MCILPKLKKKKTNLVWKVLSPFFKRGNRDPRN